MLKALGSILAGPAAFAVVLSAQSSPQLSPATQTPAAGQPAQSDPHYVIDDTFTRGAAPEGTPGLTLPAVIREILPSYTPAAMRGKIQGDVLVRTRVGADGRVQDVRVEQSLDRGGLDEEAMKAARQHLFKPAQLNGTAVDSLVTLTRKFRLH